MFLKRLKLTNYRKFSSEKNIVEFISSQIVLNQDNNDINDNFEGVYLKLKEIFEN